MIEEVKTVLGYNKLFLSESRWGGVFLSGLKSDLIQAKLELEQAGFKCYWTGNIPPRLHVVNE